MALPPIGQITPVTPAAPATPAPGATTAAQGSGSGFGSLLAGEIGKLDALQQQATTASQQLATGQSADVSTVVMQVEQASLALQLAAQVRNKAVDAYNELFRMQV